MKVHFNLTSDTIQLPKAEKKEMISVRVENGKTFVRINSSSLSVINECRRKAKYVLYDGLKSNTEPSSTVFGSAIHKALEVFYSGKIEERFLPKYETVELMGYGHKVDNEDSDLILRSIKAFIDTAKALEALPATDKRSIPNGVWILWNYFKSYLTDPYIAFVDEKGPFIERDFTYTVYEDNQLKIDYFGRIDLVVRHSITNEMMIADHKTSSVVGNDFYNRLKPNHQYTGYVLAGKKIFGIPSNSFMVNCIQVKEKPKTSRGTEPHFPRQVTTRDEDDFQEFTEAVIDATKAYLRSMETDIWPIGNVNSCAMYAGCSYLNVCSAPKALRNNILAAKFNKGL